jgi:hypothetical protein
VASFLVYVWDDSPGASKLSTICTTDSRRFVDVLIEIGMLHHWRIEVREEGGNRIRYGEWSSTHGFEY